MGTALSPDDLSNGAFDEELPERLARRLRKPLPGRAAQSMFEPEGADGRHYVWAETARQAAVVMLLYPHQGVWHLPLTVRPQTLPHHPGQVSLPGGAVEPGESSQQAALRELEEELGVSLGADCLIGGLTPLYVAASNFLVTPWAAAIDHRPEWLPSPDEVDELLETPVPDLLAPQRRGVWAQETPAGGVRRAPYFDVLGHRVWGATSMILSELAWVLTESMTEER